MGSQLPLKAAQPPIFGLCLLWPNGWMKMPLGTEVDLGPGHIVLDGVPALRERGTAAPPPLFGPCLLWPRSPISATAELLYTMLLRTKLVLNESTAVLHTIGTMSQTRPALCDAGSQKLQSAPKLRGRRGASRRVQRQHRRRT